MIVKLTLVVVVLSAALLGNSCTGSDKPDSSFKGAQIGVISNSWHSMPWGEGETSLGDPGKLVFSGKEDDTAAASTYIMVSLQ
jgi:hypothetical protein